MAVRGRRSASQRGVPTNTSLAARQLPTKDRTQADCAFDQTPLVQVTPLQIYFGSTSMTSVPPAVNANLEPARALLAFRPGCNIPSSWMVGTRQATPRIFFELLPVPDCRSGLR